MYQLKEFSFGLFSVDVRYIHRGGKIENIKKVLNRKSNTRKLIRKEKKLFSNFFIKCSFDLYFMCKKKCYRAKSIAQQGMH